MRTCVLFHTPVRGLKREATICPLECLTHSMSDNPPNDHGFVARARRFLKKPLSEKVTTVVFHGLLNVQHPVRLPSGARWIPRGDHVGGPAQEGKFEPAELAFVEAFLRPGMTALDIGAHNGLYSLLASKKVGPRGRVISFEPSPRERKALRLNLALNWMRNVSVQGMALGSEAGEADFYLVEGYATGCNSLRPPAVESETRKLRVKTISLDEFLRDRRIHRVDFIKLDTEGAELEILRGARKLLSAPPRPVLLVEVSEIRTAPWGYSAREILRFMEQLEYLWFGIRADGSLAELQPGHDLCDTNLVAVPKEQREVPEGAVEIGTQSEPDASPVPVFAS
jgi:FkbM family methyltransferase